MLDILTNILKTLSTNPVVIGAGAVIVWKVIEKIVKLTKTTIDDKIISKIKHLGKIAFNTVELIENTGGIKLLLKEFGVKEKNIAKYKKAISIFESNYKKQTGKKPSNGMIKEVAEMFKEYAVYDKNMKEVIWDAVTRAVKGKVSKKK